MVSSQNPNIVPPVAKNIKVITTSKNSLPFVFCDTVFIAILNVPVLFTIPTIPPSTSTKIIISIDSTIPEIGAAIKSCKP